METTIIWIITGIIVALIAVWGIVYYILKKNSKPTFTSAHGIKVFCEAKHMKTRRQDVEEETERIIKILCCKFERGRMIEELRRLTLIFKKKPFKPQNIVNSKEQPEKLNGVYNPKDKLVAVCVKEFGDLSKTAMAHEFIHFFIDVILHKSGHINEYFNLIGEYYE